MKVPASIRDAYENQKEAQGILEQKVRDTLSPLLHKTWHYEGRLKELESFALKMETGRFDPKDLEDFFACTIVVPTMAFLDECEELVGGLFDITGRKPTSEGLALKQPFDFPFDHTRLYARLRVPAGVDPGVIHSLRFEVQIKTYLQHAWSIATHDLTYKSSEVSWGTQRVAAQVKATLEAAEVAIVEAENLVRTGNRVLGRQDASTAELVRVVTILKENFTRYELPADARRLAQSVYETLTACGLKPSSLGRLMASGRAAHGGVHPNDLSPYSTVVQYIAECNPNALLRALRRANGPKIFLATEVSLPAMFDGVSMPGARRPE